MDRWILSRVAATVAQSSAALTGYEFSAYAQQLRDFFWRDLCDWYIEAIKPTVADNGRQHQILATCLDVSLRLLHPVMPFITERLWEALHEVRPERGHPGIELPPSPLLMEAAWPQVESGLRDHEAERTFGQVQELVGAIRELRATHQVPPRKSIRTSFKAPAAGDEPLTACRPLIETLAHASCAAWGPEVTRPAHSAATVVGPIEVYAHDLGDEQIQTERRHKAIEAKKKSIAALEGRLANKNYVDKAPAHLVQETRDQLAAAQQELRMLEEQT